MEDRVNQTFISREEFQNLTRKTIRNSNGLEVILISSPVTKGISSYSSIVGCECKIPNGLDEVQAKLLKNNLLIEVERIIHGPARNLTTLYANTFSEGNDIIFIAKLVYIDVLSGDKCSLINRNLIKNLERFLSEDRSKNPLKNFFRKYIDKFFKSR